MTIGPRFHQLIGFASTAAMTLGGAAAPRAQARVPLVVEAGRPVQVALDRRVTITRAGQAIDGTVVEPVYVYDRIVIPAGTRAIGHVTRLDGPSRLIRLRAIAAGDLTPARHVVVQFDTLVLPDQREVPIRTVVTTTVPHPRRTVAAGSEVPADAGRLTKTRAEATNRAREAIASVKQQAHDALAAVTQPGRMERLKEAAIQRLPYHPQYLSRGTVYRAELTAPLDFGTAPRAVSAPAGTLPPPASVLHARLATPLDSSKTRRGTPIDAVVTEPVFSADGHVILPEGTKLVGEVTFVKPAAHFHHNGQLRFLFERVQAPERDTSPMLASLHAVEASADERVSVDEEGGATLSNSNTRFIAPAVALLMLHATTDHDRHFDHDGDANDVAGATVQSGGAVTRGAGGFLGLSVLGVGLSQISRPVGIALAAAGAARTVYTNVLGRGRDVTFPADTPIELQLAPGADPKQ